jgi:hypothetical protein
MEDFVFDGLDNLIKIFGLGFGAGMLIGMGTWTANKVVQVFRKFF